MLGGDKRSYILQETEVFSCGFINNSCILTLCVFQKFMHVFFVVTVVTVLCTCTGYYHFCECML